MKSSAKNITFRINNNQFVMISDDFSYIYEIKNNLSTNEIINNLIFNIDKFLLENSPIFKVNNSTGSVIVV